jgi:hypothetical protein
VNWLLFWRFTRLWLAKTIAQLATRLRISLKMRIEMFLWLAFVAKAYAIGSKSQSEFLREKRQPFFLFLALRLFLLLPPHRL